MPGARMSDPRPIPPWLKDQRTEEQRHIDKQAITVDRHTLDDYWNAPSGIGPLADEWADKPHHLLYDLIGKIEDAFGTFS